MKKFLVVLVCVCASVLVSAQDKISADKDFPVRGFHLDLRIQVMTMPALRQFALQLKNAGMNTLIMEWEATYPFEKHPLIPNRYAYSKQEIVSFISYCKTLGIDVIPLQQSFGHVEYILRHYKYRNLREDQKDYSQVCPLEVEGDKKLFTELFTELVSTHPSKYFHIGGDETYLLGHCPKCSRKAALEGTSKLYIDHIRMLCNIVISLGKRPILWADIALKYPEAIHLLPKETIFIDWNYGWDINRFGDHKKLMESGYEIWGSPSIRSHPDNYFLTQWAKHFKNISEFIPAARDFGYKGMVMTSWSTSGHYSTLEESETDIIDLYAVRHVYPITGFNILFIAFVKGLQNSQPLNMEAYIEQYCADQFGLNKEQSINFKKALLTAPYEVSQGKVAGDSTLTISQLLDSAKYAAKVFSSLTPLKNKKEFDQFSLMADIRVQYLSYANIEAYANTDDFTSKQVPETVAKLTTLLNDSKVLNKRFLALNGGYFHPEELKLENELRNSKLHILYNRLSRMR